MRHVISLLFGLFWVGVSLAQISDTPWPLSLSEAEVLLRQGNHELSLGQSAVKSAEADVKMAGQRSNPQLGMNVLSISPWSGYRAGGWRDKKMDTSFRMDQLIERGDKVHFRTRTAESQLAATRSDLQTLTRQQRQALAEAYYDLSLAQERLQAAQANAGLYRQALQAAALRYKTGDIAGVDYSRLSVEASRAENDLNQAEHGRRVAQAQLAYLIGQEDRALQLQAVDAWPVLEMPESPTTAWAQRPEIRAAQQRIEAADAARELARSLRKRDVTVGVQVEHNLQNAPTNSYGFGVSVPLFIWHEYEGEIAKAEAEWTAARQQYDQALARAKVESEQTGSQLRAAHARRQRLEQGLLADAEKVAKAAELAYAKGASGLLDLLDARRTLRQVQTEAAIARADHAKALTAWRLQVEYGNQP